MNPTDPSSMSAAVLAILVQLAIASCIAVWTVAAVRWRRGQPVLPYQPRRSVPWRLIDVALLIIAYLFAPALLVRMSPHRPDVQTTELAQVAQPPKTEMEHPLERLLSESHNGPTILLCALLAIVIAPITEELLFRLLLQGWLESLERRLRRHFIRQVPRPILVAVGIVPIAVSSLLFAALHIRGPEPPEQISTLVFRLAVMAIAGLLVITLAVWWLKSAARATWADIGIVPGKLAGDVRLGLLAFLAVLVPVYIVMFAAKHFLPANVVPDPIPMLFLGAALGTLYYRTHRIVPSIVLHAAFNATGVVLMLLSSV
jgi:membrane protease YdiL (CAAX protease family)